MFLKILASVNLCFLFYFHLNVIVAEDIEYYGSATSFDLDFKRTKRHIDGKQVKRNAQKHYVKYINVYNDSVNQLKNMRTDIHKRAVDPVFHGHSKTREELWNEIFLNETKAFDQAPSLIKLLNKITVKHLNDCTPVILYDSQFETDNVDLFQNLFKTFPVSYIQGKINDNDKLENPNIIQPVRECLHFMVFLTEIQKCAKVIGLQSSSKVVIVASSSQWAVQEFLAGPQSRKFVNLLVIGLSFKDGDDTIEAPYILYTHKLYTDGLGASKPVVLNSWTHGKFSREVNLFPPKMTEGYAEHRFIVAAANQPPFVVRRIQSDSDGGNPRVVWDGIEVRILQLLAQRNNFSIEIIEPRELHLGPGDAVAKEIASGRADVGIAGIYTTIDRIGEMDISLSHSQDCAVFITLLSTALPRYRAILGPFHWHVWVALTFTYLIGILPLAFSDKHTLSHLLHNSGEIENMFWYVFGTFTNCFTFVGKNSWSKTTKLTTRLLIGWYWIFTIIITSCYTGSIIAFVTLPIFPETVDTIDQLMQGFFRLGTLDKGGWERWFFNSSDRKTNKLLEKIKFVPDVESGIRNITKAFFWPYAFLGSRAELEYIVQANFTKTTSKKATLHISDECFVPFGVSIGFPKQSIYTEKLNMDIQKMIQSGLLDKIENEVKWELQRSSTGKLLAASSGSLNIVSAEEKGLTLEDTQGMFLLLAAGFLIATAALISEWMGGCTRKCRLRRKKEEILPSSSSQDKLITTPKTAGSEFKIIDDNSSRLEFERSSTGSRETLEGQIINITEQDFIVHRGFEAEPYHTRRSSSADIDREIQDIFEQDNRRRRFRSDGTLKFNAPRDSDISNGTFRDHVTIG